MEMANMAASNKEIYKMSTPRIFLYVKAKCALMFCVSELRAWRIQQVQRKE